MGAAFISIISRSRKREKKIHHSCFSTFHQGWGSLVLANFQVLALFLRLSERVRNFGRLRQFASAKVEICQWKIIHKPPRSLLYKSATRTTF